ncbi:subtilisin-like protein [Anaeromyces robustus]|uniref:Subtilisin-like protein n=1 Tax=Anaeromyces robustus TaxID=1754192 RepID=A0A1Y1VWC4_9FUNG|nr:subtilisin-like protein [Anaeromyces robustus]|eukprot:ORX65296.1 subtilisin-like protein [Anaeromyces robustus]
MKNYFLLSIIIILFNYFIGVYTENANYIIAILRKESDKNYDETNDIIQQWIDELVIERMNDIYDIIEKHKDTYILENGEQDEKLEKEFNSISFKKRQNENTKYLFINKSRPNSLFEKHVKLHANPNNSTIRVTMKRRRGKKQKYLFINKNRPNNIYQRSILSSPNFNNKTTIDIDFIPFESNLVNHICPISNYYTVNAYLSEEAARIVCSLEDVIFCEKSINLKFENNVNNNDDNNNNNNNNNNNSGNKEKNNDFKNVYYNVDSIKNETNWSDVNVQEISISNNHLSLISQSAKIDKNKPIDNNFYYPSTAGHGIDIYFIDQGIIVNSEDYDTYKGTSYERTVTCDAIGTSNEIRNTTKKEKKNCRYKNEYPEHGIAVSSIAGGTVVGVSKKANLHMIAIDMTNISILRSLDYILLHGQPHKTIINLSVGHSDGFDKAEEDKLSDLISKGFIIINGAGNDSRNSCVDKNNKEFHAYAGYRKGISVGATETKIYEFGYRRANYSNYGDCIDIYAPGRVILPIIINESNAGYYDDGQGTSFAASIVTGVAASIMSEHPKIKYDQELMRNTLIKMAINDVISDLGSSDTPNHFINNGKRQVYYPNSSSNHDNNSSIDEKIKYSDDCNTKDRNKENKCLFKNDCKSEFNNCKNKGI